jgi:hypothetical protein
VSFEDMCWGWGREKKKKPELKLHEENRSDLKRAQIFQACKALQKHNRIG